MLIWEAGFQAVGFSVLPIPDSRRMGRAGTTWPSRVVSTSDMHPAKACSKVLILSAGTVISRVLWRDSTPLTGNEIIHSERLAKALDLKNEKPEVIERYGKKGQNYLLARRVVEAGARFVTVSSGGWDTHRDNFKNLRASRLPELDRGVSNLIRDLRERAMLEDVTVVVWGEFGRTPKINGNAGRDHWSRVMSVLLAGGGMKTGQVVGASDPKGGEPADRPFTWVKSWRPSIKTLASTPPSNN